MNWPGTDTGDGRRNKRVTLRWWFVLATIVATAVLSAPQAHANDAQWWRQWDRNVAPMGPTAAAPSADYNTARNYPPVGTPGTFQVYATPPGMVIVPSAGNYCGTTLSQAQTPSDCPAGWDLWYR